MTTTSVTPEFAISSGIGAADMASIAGQGFAAAISVAPDTEGVGESVADSDAAREAGLAFHHVPVVVGLIEDDQIAAFAKALAAAEGPVLAYCHSGLRAVLMWALAREAELGRDEVVRLAAQAGFEIAAYLDNDEEALLAA